MNKNSQIPRKFRHKVNQMSKPLGVQLRWMVTAQWRRCKTDADQGAFRRTTRMASNMLIGIPIRLPIGVLAERTRNEEPDSLGVSRAMRRLRAIYRVMRTSGYSRSLSVLWTIRAFAVGFASRPPSLTACTRLRPPGQNGHTLRAFSYAIP